MAPGDPSARAARVAALHAEARLAFPRVVLDEATFAAYLEARAPAAGAPPRLHTPDLYLACACARGDAQALAAFDAEVLDKVGPALARAGAAHLADEVKQVVREKLLLGAPGEPPRIADYAGQGALLTWVRVVALRVAATLRRGDRRTRAREDLALLDAPGALDGGDLLHLRRRYAGDFKAAFEVGVAALTPRDRNLLRQHLLDGLTIDDLGALYQVNRVTASRWLSRARERVADATREVLTARLSVTPGELSSILRLVRSDLDLSIDRVLRRA